jgi:ATP-dependent helicase YprA (DUF1998 family)/very-short-patch-repair endonuclease
VDVFQLRQDLIGDYRRYVTSFLALRDERIANHVQSNLDDGRFWPEPRVGLNPSFEPGGWIDDLVGEDLLHERCRDIFRVGKDAEDFSGAPMRLHKHQVDAIREAAAGRNYVLTTGTGSGKSLSYIVPIVDHVIRRGLGQGIQAIVVYPMNALANSQEKELEKFLQFGVPAEARVRFAKYTGQEEKEEKEAIWVNPPDILLTNYVMLELILTRNQDRQHLIDKAQGLPFLVLDELHTYRGRQGADVALLIRRLREACSAPDLRCIGTSATLSTEGSFYDQRRAVAEMATLLFGAEVRPESVIGETLRRATAPIDDWDLAMRQALHDRIDSGVVPGAYDEFVRDPMSRWIETAFGVEERDGRLVRVSPRPVAGPGGGARELAERTGADESRCETAIRAQLLGGYRVQHHETGFPAFAFRLHQFISKGDTVYASIESTATRHITLSGQRLVPEHRDKVLLPLAFCRQCGQDYYTVSRETDGDGPSMFTPRDIGDRARDARTAPGFLYIAEPGFDWPDDEDEVLDRIPEDWVEENAKGRRVKSANKKQLPVPLRVSTEGTVDDDGLRVWWAPAPFRMCLRCGVSYGGAVRSDLTKLATLGSEGRSTATTVLSVSAIEHLREEPSLRPSAKKLLSFTDNRQDASLQSGHFNDFVQVTMLRSALYDAVKAAGDTGIEYDDLAGRVFDKLDLPFAEYAVDPEVEFRARTETERALKEVVGYRLFVDLQRGWRITSPNLEQCGLLEIEYDSLTDVCAADHVWEDKHAALAGASAAEREKVALILLDHLRRELAIKVNELDPEYLEGLARRSSQRLAGDWAIDDIRQLEYARAVVPRPRRGDDTRERTYLSAYSGFGRLLRRQSTFPSFGHPIDRDTAGVLIADLFKGLKRASLVEQVDVEKDGTPCYQLPASAMRWKQGDGTRAYLDPVRLPTAPDTHPLPNPFFTDLYTGGAARFRAIEAREHTAQVPYDEREVREGRFRTADLPILYCSPTMELGVDISELNVVNMRNVPPTPANYAQRSGRAGRSGQPALVFTYCSAGSPHDQWYFAKPELMVSGQVTTPRIDLANADLVRSHVQAIWLATSGLSLGSSLKDVLHVTDETVDPPVRETVQADLRNGDARTKSREVARRVLADLVPRLEDTTWWSTTWLDDVLNAIPRSFEAATERWRTLYRSARTQYEVQGALRVSPAADAQTKRLARQLRDEAEKQLDLLTADTDRRNQSDFYSYRYFASEGFLPGYSFPRLPLSAFIPARRGGLRSDDGEFLSRPRFLAISEFGPRSLVYHEGARYEINRVILPASERTSADGEPILTTQVKQCTACGYFHPEVAGQPVDNCEQCNAPLPVPTKGLFRLHNVATRRRDRINSDEEERQRQGFEVVSAFRFAVRNNQLSRRIADATSADGRQLAEVTYGETAQLWRINRGRRRRADADQVGFLLDVDRGYWANESDEPSDDDEAPVGPRVRRVLPYVEDSRNCLLIRPAEDLDAVDRATLAAESPGRAHRPRVMASLEAALKHAIQIEFQLEENELATEPLPSLGERRWILMYESSEGGAGVLRRLAEDPTALARTSRRALELCHIEPDTGADLPMRPGHEPCEAACYDCLMSYRNQPDHPVLDRATVIPILQELAQATVDLRPDAVAVEALVESELERAWLEWLRERGLRTPDRSQVLIEDAGSRPDFLYDDQYVAIYVDGPMHDFPDRQARDGVQAQKMRDLGYRVIRFGHKDDWAQIVDGYRDVFGAPR